MAWSVPPRIPVPRHIVVVRSEGPLRAEVDQLRRSEQIQLQRGMTVSSFGYSHYAVRRTMDIAYACITIFDTLPARSGSSGAPVS